MLLRMGEEKKNKKTKYRVVESIYIFTIYMERKKKKIGLLKDLRHFSIPSIYKFLLFLFFLEEKPPL